MTRSLAMAAALALAGLGAHAGAEEALIVQKDKAFSAERLAIRAGDRVVFRNDDAVTHHVFSRSPGFEFEIKVQLPGQATPIAFDRPGEAEVRCAIHPHMKLHVTVEPKEERR